MSSFVWSETLRPGDGDGARRSRSGERPRRATRCGGVSWPRAGGRLDGRSWRRLLDRRALLSHDGDGGILRPAAPPSKNAPGTEVVVAQSARDDPPPTFDHLEAGAARELPDHGERGARPPGCGEEG